MIDRYGTPAGFRAYHIARNGDLPVTANDDDEVNSWLLVASEWLDGAFRGSFPGLKVGMREQIREWPRLGAFDDYGYVIASVIIPTEVVNATYEIALREGRTPGGLNKDYTPGKYKRVSIDGAISVEYAAFANASDTQTQYTIIGQILRPILTGNSVGVNGLSGSAIRA